MGGGEVHLMRDADMAERETNLQNDNSWVIWAHTNTCPESTNKVDGTPPFMPHKSPGRPISHKEVQNALIQFINI